MKINDLIDKVRRNERVTFQDTIQTITENYDYFPTRFTIGESESMVVNEAGTNEGSCRIFFFARLNGLSTEQTLALFGDYYWVDVLEHPDEENHTNIRAFMRSAGPTVNFEGVPLKPKSAAK